MNFSLLKTMCAIQAPSGNEEALKDFLLEHINKNKKNWKHNPKIYEGKGFKDCIVLVFGKPRTAIFAHMDNIGFTVRYGKQLVKIGGPVLKDGIALVGSDSKGKAEAKLKVMKQKDAPTKIEYTCKRDLDRGTELSYKPVWRETKTHVQCCYMDNRLGIYNALQVAATLKDGIIVFSCYEEHGGGSVQYLQKFIAEKYKVSQALISDISWISDGVHSGQGAVISLRDSLIPRRKFTDKIVRLARKHNIVHQLEVEGSGGSDAKDLQMAEYPWDWCFIGAGEEHVHSPDEKVHKKDIESMIALYKMLMKEL
jgi:putative aminopeptidase FrvX